MRKIKPFYSLLICIINGVSFKKENFGQKLKHSLVAPTYHVLGHASQVIQLDKTDLSRLLNSAKPLTEDVPQYTVGQVPYIC